MKKARHNYGRQLTVDAKGLSPGLCWVLEAVPAWPGSRLWLPAAVLGLASQRVVYHQQHHLHLVRHAAPQTCQVEICTLADRPGGISVQMLPRGCTDKRCLHLHEARCYREWESKWPAHTLAA